MLNIKLCNTTRGGREGVVHEMLFLGFLLVVSIDLFCFQILRFSTMPDKLKLFWYAMKIDLVSLARLAGKIAVRYKIVGIQVT